MLPLPFTSRFVKGYHVALATFSLIYFSLTAVDVSSAMLQAEGSLEQESDIHSLIMDSYYVCPRFPDLCSLPAGGK